MPVAVWKMHHPCFLCFFDYFYLSHAGGGFRIHSELFCLWGSGDIVFGLRGAVFVWLPTGKDHCSNDALASKTDTDKKLDDTNHSEFDVKVKLGRPPVLQITGRCIRKEMLCWSFRLFVVALL